MCAEFITIREQVIIKKESRDRCPRLSSLILSSLCLLERAPIFPVLLIGGQCVGPSEFLTVQWRTRRAG